MSWFGKSPEDQLKDFCDSHWLKKVAVDEAKSTLKIAFKHRSYEVPFSLNFFDIIKEVRFAGLVFPINHSVCVRLDFPVKNSDDMTVILKIGKVITLDMAQKNLEDGKDMVFVTDTNREYVLKREPV